MTPGPQWHYADRNVSVGVILVVALVWGVAAVLLAIGRKARKR